MGWVLGLVIANKLEGTLATRTIVDRSETPRHLVIWLSTWHWCIRRDIIEAGIRQSAVTRLGIAHLVVEVVSCIALIGKALVPDSLRIRLRSLVLGAEGEAETGGIAEAFVCAATRV